MWSQSVIVEVYSFSVCSFAFVLVFLLRWIHAPHQYRYLYLAMFMFGITFTNHQSLIIAAMGIEVAIAAAHFRLGRWLFLGNSICYVAGLLLKQQGMITTLDANPGDPDHLPCRRDRVHPGLRLVLDPDQGDLHGVLF